MTKNSNSQISGGFIFILLAVIAVIAGYFAFEEINFKNRAQPVKGKILNVRAVPKKSLLSVNYQTASGSNIITVSVPSWDSREVGAEIELLIDGQDIKINELLYIHRMSISIVLGSLFLFAVVAIALKLTK